MNELMVPEMELEEAIRWMFRHQVNLDFSEGERPGTIEMHVATPLRNDTSCDVVTVQVQNHDDAGVLFLEVITAARKRLGYE